MGFCNPLIFFLDASTDTKDDVMPKDVDNQIDLDDCPLPTIALRDTRACHEPYGYDLNPVVPQKSQSSRGDGT